MDIIKVLPRNLAGRFSYWFLCVFPTLSIPRLIFIVYQYILRTRKEYDPRLRAQEWGLILFYCAYFEQHCFEASM